MCLFSLQLHCCGATNYSNYWAEDVKGGIEGRVPESCCRNMTLCKKIPAEEHGWIKLPNISLEEAKLYIYTEVS